MTQSFISELLVVSLVVLLLVLVVLLVLMVLCRVLKSTGSRNFTELKISTGGAARKLTIRTEPDNAHQLLDHLLDRVYLQVGTLGQEPGAEPGEELGSSSHSVSDPEVSTAASLRSRAVNALRDKVWKWITVTSPPAETSPPPPPPPPNSPASPGQMDVEPEQLDAAQYVSLSSSSSSDEESRL